MSCVILSRHAAVRVGNAAHESTIHALVYTNKEILTFIITLNRCQVIGTIGLNIRKVPAE